MWGIFESESSVHVIPCDRRGDILPPHIADDLCSCRPDVIEVGEDGQLIMNHHEVH